MADFPASHVWLPEGSFQDIARIIQESIQGLELQPSWLWRREACRLWFYMIFLLSYVIPCDSPPSMDWFVGQTLQENPMIFVGKLMVSCKFAPTNQCIDTLFHHPFQWDFHGCHRRLNAAIKPIWDHLDAGVRKIIEDEIRPALQQRLGKRLGRST